MIARAVFWSSSISFTTGKGAIRVIPPPAQAHEPDAKRGVEDGRDDFGGVDGREKGHAGPFI